MANFYHSPNFLKTLRKHLHLVLFLSSTLFLSCSDPFFSGTEDPEPIIPETAISNSYYLSKDGDDANPGTKEKPWRTLARVNSVDLEPGEIVYLEGGSTFSGTLLLDSLDNGAKGKPVVITSYGLGIATINSGHKEAVIIKSNYFHLKAINAKGAGRKTGNTTNGIELTRAHHGVVEQVTTEGFQHSGLKIYSCHNIEVIKVTAKGNGFCGIYVTGEFLEQNGKYLLSENSDHHSRNITLKNCLAEDNPGDPTILDNHSGNGILIELTKGALVEHCTATNNGWDMPRTGNGPVGIWVASSDSVIIQHCISYRNKTSAGGLDGGGFDLDGGVTNSIIQYCLSYENDGAGFGLFQWDGAGDWDNNIIRYSISLDDGKGQYGGFTIWNGSNDSKQFSNAFAYNNVVISKRSSGVKFFGDSNNKGFTFYNNIFIGQGLIVDGPSSGEKFLGNTYWQVPGGNGISFRGHRSLQEWA
ncbi:right-handed parallel beta-helix repeat-containing protein, partial [Rufibacter glacialis]